MKQIKNPIRINSHRSIRRRRIHPSPGHSIHIHIPSINHIHRLLSIARPHRTIISACGGRILALVEIIRHVGFPGGFLTLFRGVCGGVVDGGDGVVITSVFFGCVAWGLLVFGVVLHSLHCWGTSGISLSFYQEISAYVIIFRRRGCAVRSHEPRWLVGSAPDSRELTGEKVRPSSSCWTSDWQPIHKAN